MRPCWKMLIVLAAGVPMAPTASADGPTSQADVSSLIAAARDGFRPAAAGELDAARQAVLAARQSLLGKLATRPDGQSKSEALRLDEIAAALNSPLEVGPLERLANNLGLSRHGVAGPELVQLRAAIDRLLKILRTSADERVAAEYARQIDRLTVVWENYRSSQRTEEGLEIQEICRWLDDRGQAPELTDALRGAASHPNHRMLVSAAFLEQALSRDIRQPLASDEKSQGAQVRVRGQIKGKLVPVLVPNADAGAVRVQFVGVGDSRIVANKGPVTLQARGATGIRASETAYLSERGLSASAPKVAVEHRSTPTAVGVNLRSRLLRRVVSRIAWKVAGRQQAQSDRKAAASTQNKIDAEVRAQTAKFVAQANDVVRRFGVFNLLASQPAETLKISTTERHLQWLGQYASARQLAAPSPAPASVADPAVLVQLHESAVNNSGNWIGGRTIDDSDFRELTFESIGLVPEGFDDLAAQLPATITFADEQPLTVRIDGGKIQVSLRLKAFSSQASQSADRVWTARATYQPQYAGGKIALVRTTPITVEGGDSAEASKLAQTLSRFLVAKTASPDLAGKSLAPLPPLMIGQFTLDDGWLTLALVAMQPAAKQAAAVTKVAARR